MTGLDCPGCGMQRSFVALLEGDFVESFILYPPLLPVIITLVLLIRQVLFRRGQEAILVKYAYLSTAGVIVINYVVKLIHLAH